MKPSSLTTKSDFKEEIRCHCCRKLLARGVEGIKTFEIKCSRCGTINSLFRNIPDQVVITDYDGVIIYANENIKNVTGYEIHEIIGKRPSLWGGQMSKEFYKELWKVIKTDKKSVLVRVKNKRKDGTIYDAHLRISPVLDTQGNIQVFIGIETIIE